jgi:hypothetical protein
VKSDPQARGYFSFREAGYLGGVTHRKIIDDWLNGHRKCDTNMTPDCKKLEPLVGFGRLSRDC